jgi:endo-alpha-1,4-polygalactosaminidase (GH114 family)
VNLVLHERAGSDSNTTVFTAAIAGLIHRDLRKKKEEEQQRTKETRKRKKRLERCIYSLEYTETPVVFFMPHTDDDVSRAIKGINVTMVYKLIVAM